MLAWHDVRVRSTELAPPQGLIHQPLLTAPPHTCLQCSPALTPPELSVPISSLLLLLHPANINLEHWEWRKIRAVEALVSRKRGASSVFYRIC